MDKHTKAFVDFLNASHSEFHAVAALEKQLREADYRKLSEGEDWDLTPGGKYYLIRGGNALVAFRVPVQTPGCFMISASHSDRPTFKVKENGELTGTYTRLATEKYGGMLIAPWLDRPLSIAGRVAVETENGIRTRLVDIDRDLLLIPNVAIHMNRKANDGYTWNPAVDTLPLVGSKDAGGKLQALLETAAGGKILGHDLYLYIREKAVIWGLEENYISGPGLDDLACAWTCTQGFLQAGESRGIPVLCVFDSEEVGSGSAQGAASPFLDNILRRICEALQLSALQMLSRSFVVSADNAHAVHPNHPEFADAGNAPVLGEGVVIKFNAERRYTTDGVSAAVFRKICGKAGVQTQTYYNRADVPGGATLGRILLSQVAVPMVDIGVPQLAMHSGYETADIRDVLAMEKAMQMFYGSACLNDDGESMEIL